jgi:hypothetical protein
MVDGGFYGYPWDYKPRRPYTLWMMGDYGGGSGCASIAYNEDALPAEVPREPLPLRLGAQEVLRLEIVRDGRDVEDRLDGGSSSSGAARVPAARPGGLAGRDVDLRLRLELRRLDGEGKQTGR